MIKKVVSCIVLLLMIASLAASAAAETDLSALLDDEIMSLAQQIDEEMVRRGLPKTATLPKGAYIAGQDIPAGSYVYTCLATGDDWGNLTVYSDKGEGDQLLWNVVSAPDDGEAQETVFIRLNDGDELKSGVPFSLTVAAGIFFK